MATQKVNIDVRTKGAKKSKDEIGGLGRSIKSLGTAAIGAGAAYFGTRGLINAIVSSTEAFGIQEQAEKALEVALGRTSTELLNQASALQKVTTAGDESIIQQQAFLASLKFTEEQIKTIIPVALDLSAATGISLESAVRNTSKTFSGLAGELGELVPQLRDLTTEEMKSGKAVKVLGELFEGQASEQAKTMSGALDQAMNSAGDLAEAIGEKLSPLIKVLAEDFTVATESLTGFIGPEMISREKQLQSLLEQRSKLIGDNIEKTEEAVLVSDLFTDSALEQRNIQKDTLDFGVNAIDEQIEKFGELLFIKESEKKAEKDGMKAVFNLEIERASNAIEFAKIENQLINDSFLLEGKRKKQKEEILIQDLKNAALSGKSAKDAMKAVVRAETMEAVAGYIASVLKNVPFPINVALAAGGGALVSGLIDKGLSAFATGGDFVTSGPQMIMVGDNPGGRERVQVTPLSSQNINGPQGGITLNISAPLVDETVVDSIIPAIEKAQRMNLA